MFPIATQFDVNQMKRPRLNLIMVLNNSGSMRSSFDAQSSESKMAVAAKAVLHCSRT